MFGNNVDYDGDTKLIFLRSGTLRVRANSHKELAMTLVYLETLSNEYSIIFSWCEIVMLEIQV